MPKFSPIAACTAAGMSRGRALPGIKLWNNYKQIAVFHGSKKAAASVRRQALAAGGKPHSTIECRIDLPDGKWLEVYERGVYYFGPKSQAAFTIPLYD